MDLFKLNGDVALVTGAGSGIGQAIAIGLAEAGADVACFGHTSKGGLDETAHRITALGRKALVLAGTVTSEGDLATAIDRIEAELGALTVAVNNAGIAGSEPAEALSLDKWRRVRGLTQAHYNSSKAAVIHMSKSLAMEWADRGLRVNVVSPGYTLTPMNKRPEVAEEVKIFKRDTPMGRMAAPEEMVGPTVFLASRASSFVTGLDLIVDGGYVCWEQACEPCPSASADLACSLKYAANVALVVARHERWYI